MCFELTNVIMQSNVVINDFLSTNKCYMLSIMDNEYSLLYNINAYQMYYYSLNGREQPPALESWKSVQSASREDLRHYPKGLPKITKVFCTLYY